MALQGAALLPYGSSGAMWERTRRRAAARGVWERLGLAFEEFVSAAKQAASINTGVAFPARKPGLGVLCRLRAACGSDEERSKVWEQLE